MAAKSDRMAIRRRLERAFLEPETVSEILRRLVRFLFVRLSLRLIGLMTDRTALWFRGFFLLLLPADSDEARSSYARHNWSIKANNSRFFAVREADLEFRAQLSSLQASHGDISETRKQKTRRIARRYVHMTV